MRVLSRVVGGLGWLVLVVACGSSKGVVANQPTGTAIVRVTLSPPAAAARRFVPGTTTQVRLTARREAADPVVATGAVGATIVVTLAVGTYALTVDALGAAGTVLATKTVGGVEIRAGANTDVRVQLTPVDRQATARHLLEAHARLFLDRCTIRVPDRFTAVPEESSNDSLLGYAVAILAAQRLGLSTTPTPAERAAAIVGWLNTGLPCDASGVAVHFSRTDTGAAYGTTEYSILTAAYTALAAQLLAVQFAELANAANAYCERIRWTDYLTPNGRFYFSRGQDGVLRDPAGYLTDELLIVCAMARASHTWQPPESIWSGFEIVSRSYDSTAFGRLTVPAVTDDAAAFESLMFANFWDPSTAPAPVDVKQNTIATLLAHRAYVTEVLGLPVGLGRTPGYYRETGNYLLLGARPFGGSDRSSVEPKLVATMPALAALPFDAVDSRVGAFGDVAWFVNASGLLDTTGVLFDMVRIDGATITAGTHLTSFNLSLAIAGLYNEVMGDQGLPQLNPVALRQPDRSVYPAGTCFVTVRATATPTAPSELYRLNPDGTAARLGAGLAFESPAQPVCPPDGRDSRVYFTATSTADAGRLAVFAIDRNGTLTKLTTDPYGHSNDSSPLVSVGQRHLVFLTTRSGSPARWRLAEAGLTQGSGVGLTLPGDPLAWSATDAGKLWYSAADGTVTEWDADTRQATGRTVPQQVRANRPGAWSPDGRYLAFADDSDRVTVVGTDGVVVQRFDVLGLAPSWSSSSTLLYLARDDTRRDGYYRASVASPSATWVPLPLTGYTLTAAPAAWPVNGTTGRRR